MFSKANPLGALTLVILYLGLGCSVRSLPIAESTSTTVVEMISIATPSMVPTNPITPTVTIPAPSEEESKVIALNLLENNGNCRLPCIWGLTPGITTTAERQNILTSYGEFSESDFSMSGSDASKNPGGFGIAIIKDAARTTVGVNYYETENLIEILSLVSYTQRDDKYVYGDSNYLDLIEYYTLPQLLSSYGLPSDVLVVAWPHDPFLKADYEPFSLVVIYSNLGIMAEYISPTQWIGEMVELPTPGLWVGEIARGCPSQSRLTIRTWDVKKNISIKKIASIAAGEGISETAYDYFKPIQEATSISLADFYNTFKEPNNNQCINVPSDRLWAP